MISDELQISPERRSAYLALAQDDQAQRAMAREAFYGQRFLDIDTWNDSTILNDIAERIEQGLLEGFSSKAENDEDSNAIGVLEDHIKDSATLFGTINPDVRHQLSGKIEGRISAIQRLEMHNINFEAADRVLTAVVDRLAPAQTPTLSHQARR